MEGEAPLIDMSGGPPGIIHGIIDGVCDECARKSAADFAKAFTSLLKPTPPRMIA